MRLKKITLLIIIALVISLFTIKLEASNNTLNISVQSFGSTNIYEIDNNYEKKDEKELKKYLEEAKNITLKLSELSDNFNSSSKFNNVYYINKRPNQEIEVDYHLYKMLELSLKYKEKTNGYFDVSIGFIIDEWKKLIDTSNISKVEYNSKVEEIKNIPVIEDGIILSSSNHRYYVKIKDNVKIDLGAIAKGYAVQVVDDFFKDKGLKYYRVEGSSSSLNYGENGDRTGGYFYIGVEHPNITKLYGYIKIKNKNLTTSGDTVQNNLLYGDFMHHIISPKSKVPENYYRVFSLITDDAAYGDALSTALFSMDEEDMLKWTEENGIEFIAIKFDGTVINRLTSNEFVVLEDDPNITLDVEISKVYNVSSKFLNSKNISIEVIIDDKFKLIDFDILESQLKKSELEVVSESLNKIKNSKNSIMNLQNKLSVKDDLSTETLNLIKNLGYFINGEESKIEDESFNIEFVKNVFVKIDVKDKSKNELSETLKSWLIISGVIIILGFAFYFIGRKQEES